MALDAIRTVLCPCTTFSMSAKQVTSLLIHARLLVLLSNPWHEHVILRLVCLASQVSHDLLIALNLPLAQGVPQKLPSLPLLLILLFQHVLQ